MGAYDEGTGLLVWRSRRLPGGRQPDATFAPYGTRTVVARWRRNLTVDTTGWRPGSTSSSSGHVRAGRPRCPTSSPRRRRRHGRAGRPVHHLAGLQPVGRLQPLPRPRRRPPRATRSASTGPTTGRGRCQRLPHGRHPGRRARGAARRAAVVLHQRRPARTPRTRSRAPAATSPWATTSTGPPTMRDAVAGARDAGTNLAFLGANTMYWRIRLEPRHRAGPVVVGYRDAAHLDPLRDERPREATARFRDAPAPRPEHDLIGMQYECYPVDTDYVVVVAGLVGVPRHRRRVGDASPAWSGPRPTGSTPTGDCRGRCRSSATRRTPAGASPRRPSRSTTRPAGGGRLQRRHPALGLRPGRPVRAPAGAQDQPVRPDRDRQPAPEFAARPGRGRHPARDNVDEFDLPRSTRSRRVEPAGWAIGHHGAMARSRAPSDGPAARGAVGAAAVARRAALAGGCSGDQPDDEPTPDAESGGAERRRRSRGAGGSTSRRAPRSRRASATCSPTTWSQAFLGDFPREDFVRAFDVFTSGAAREAARDIDLLTGARFEDAAAVRCHAARRAPLLPRRRPGRGRATAAVRFGFEATWRTASTRPFSARRAAHADGRATAPGRSSGTTSRATTATPADAEAAS